jgi:hypothetical protein
MQSNVACFIGRVTESRMFEFDVKLSSTCLFLSLT